MEDAMEVDSATPAPGTSAPTEITDQYAKELLLLLGKPYMVGARDVQQFLFFRSNTLCSMYMPHFGQHLNCKTLNCDLQYGCLLLPITVLIFLVHLTVDQFQHSCVAIMEV